MVPSPRKKRSRRKPTPPAEGELLSREKFIETTREYLDLLTRPIVEGRSPSSGGRELVAQYTRMVDTIVAILFQRAAEEHGLNADETEIAVIAMGGYGRAELAPYSDVDLLVLCKRKTRLMDRVAGSFIRLLWDVGFELGHTVESVVESESALARHMDTKTAMIESRCVCGSRRVARDAEMQIKRMRRNDRTEFLQRKIKDAIARHEKYGHSFQLIEPNIKLSPGGLRDYQTLVWLGQVSRQSRGLAALRMKGLLLRGEERELEDAYDFLLRVRMELHAITKSKQDQLTIDKQRAIAKTLGYRDKGGHLAVEFLMREYYRQTRAIFRITRDVLEELDYGDDVGLMIGKRRIARDGNALRLPIVTKKIQEEPLYVFERQKETGQKLDRGLRRRLEVALHEKLKGATALRRMRAAFLRLMSDDDNIALVVRSLHETLFLMRIIPEYDRLTCLKRYDLYHHYTVDEHSFKVLENLTRLGGADADPADPFVRLYSEISDKRPLLLAALLHDIGKIEGRGHAKKGARLARKILSRMRLPADETDFVCFLIEHHLLMSHYSQRRDPSDLGTITSFCEQVGDRTRLKYLCLLTAGDYKATSPEVWSEWKATLLWGLYIRAYDFIAKKEKQPEQVYKQHKQQLLEAFPAGEARERALAHLDLLPGGYLLTNTPVMVAEHMSMITALEGKRFVVSHETAGAASRITFCTKDKPFRLSQLCGVLTINDFNILHAHAFTRRDGKVVDVFTVEGVGGEVGGEALRARLDSIRDDLKHVLNGRLNLAEATTRHAARWRRRVKSYIPIPLTVRFENDISNDYTIIDIFAEDRPGLLYRITHALSRENLTIYRANISTEANRAIDSFYIADTDGGKITDPSRLDSVRAALESAVD